MLVMILTMEILNLASTSLLRLVNGYRVSVTQIRTDLHLLLMSFPSSDGTSTRLDHGQRSGFATFD
jgi:hypothetical protein